MNDENLDSLIEEIEGKRLKIEDTSLVRRGLFRTMSRKMSFTRPGIPNFDEFETQSLARFDSQASINSVSSRISVKSAFTKSPTKLFQKVYKFYYLALNNFYLQSRGMSFQADSRSMLNLPDIQRNMTKTFTKPLRKIINNFTKPNTPKGKNCTTPKNTNFSIQNHVNQKARLAVCSRTIIVLEKFLYSSHSLKIPKSLSISVLPFEHPF